MKITTITFLATATSVWLAPKNKGFGAGYLNGYGGKVKENETLMEGAIREVAEESTVILRPGHLMFIATIDFYRQNEHIFKCFIFLAKWYNGEPQATEEMGKPILCERDNLPLEKMWKGDALWLPYVMKEKPILEGGFVRYDQDMTEVREFFLPEI